jgi:hypothetical protein
MASTAAAIRERVTEYDAVCLGCGGPLVQVDTRQVFGRPWGQRRLTYVHARYADWSGDRHEADPHLTDFVRLVAEAGALLRASR